MGIMSHMVGESAVQSHDAPLQQLADFGLDIGDFSR